MGFAGLPLANCALPEMTAPIFQVNFDDAGHFVEAGRFGFGIDVEIHARDHGLHVGPLHHGVRIFDQAGLAVAAAEC